MATLLVEQFDLKAFRALMDFHPSISRVIPLNPMAGEAMGPLPLPSIGGSFHWRPDDEFVQWFIEWLTWVDENITYDRTRFDYPLMFHCLNLLKNIIEVFLKRALFIKEEVLTPLPDMIFYLHGAMTKDIIDSDSYFKGTPVYRRIMESWPGINLEMVPVSGKGQVPRKRYFRDVEAIRRVYDYVRTLAFLPCWFRGLKLIFADVIPEKMREACLSGHRTVLLPREKRLSKFDFRSFKVLASKEIYTKISDQFSLPYEMVWKVLSPRINYLMLSIIPEILEFAEFYLGYLVKEAPDYILFSRRNKPYLYGALIAARRLGIPSVYVRHGWDMKVAWEDRWTRLEPFSFFVPKGVFDGELFDARTKSCQRGCVII